MDGRGGCLRLAALALVLASAGVVSAGQVSGPVTNRDPEAGKAREQRERLRGLGTVSVSVLIDWGSGAESIEVNALARKRLESAGLVVLEKADAQLDIVRFESDRMFEVELTETACLKRDPSVTTRAKTWELPFRNNQAIDGSERSGKDKILAAIDAFLKDYRLANPGLPARK